MLSRITVTPDAWKSNPLRNDFGVTWTTYVPKLMSNIDSFVKWIIVELGNTTAGKRKPGL